MIIRAFTLANRALLLGALASLPGAVRGDDAVVVTLGAGQTSLLLGQTTTVTVFGQIDAAIEADSDQIFSWEIDVHNNNGAVAAGYGNVLTPTSDNGMASSDGTSDGDHLRGIYDLFLGTPGAGKGSPVVLVQFEVTALAPGTATFSARPAGDNAPLTFDFVVSKTGGDSFTGGNYSAASLVITVGDLATLQPVVTVTGTTAELSYTPLAGFNHTAQWSPDLQPESWIDLPGAPHNTGNVTDDITGAERRFYRVVLALP